MGDLRKKYEILELIGRGPFGRVYKLKNRNTNELLAVKIIDKEEFRENLSFVEEEEEEFKKFENDLINEVNIMKLLYNQENGNINSVKFYEYFNNEKYFSIIMELCDSNLSRFLAKKRNDFNKDEIKEILRQLNNTLYLLFKNNIIHRNLKLEKILIKFTNEEKSKFIVKLCGFHQAIKLLTPNQKCNDIVGTMLYMAPEILKNEEYDYKVDLWSLGVMIYRLYFGKFPFLGGTEAAFLHIYEENLIKFKKTGDIILDDLINKLLTIDPKKRITWEEYFNHPFFDNKIPKKQIQIEKIDFRQKYIDLKEIGKGAFCIVYKGKINNSNEYRALKIFNKNDIKNNIPIGVNLEEYFNKFMKDILNEIEIMKICNLNDNNINSVKFYECFDTEKEFVIVMELCDDNLKNILKEKKEGFNEDEIKDIIQQLNNTFKIMVNNKIIHRDLKLENILIKYINDKKNKFIVKLSDFGVSRKLNTLTQKCQTFTGTLIYMAPEILNEEEYNNKCDLWSLGIIIYQLFFKDPPYNAIREIGLLRKIEKLGKSALKKTKVDLLDDLIDKLLEKDLCKRLSWEDYFKHPFIKGNTK